MARLSGRARRERAVAIEALKVDALLGAKAPSIVVIAGLVPAIHSVTAASLENRYGMDAVVILGLDPRTRHDDRK